jgi:catechol 2,3-dioxygenase-like lactoylglutathione lyase family enzyme
MPRIRHIALVAHDSEKVAQFYKSAFGMVEVARQGAASLVKGQQAIYLSDGYLNLAVLPLADRAEGLYHFGFQVDDIANVYTAAIDAGATPPPYQLPRDGRYAETFVLDPVGIKLDLSPGWAIANPPAPAETAQAGSNI